MRQSHRAKPYAELFYRLIKVEVYGILSFPSRVGLYFVAVILILLRSRFRIVLLNVEINSF